MQAMIEAVGDVFVVHLRGRIDYETQEQFRSHCLRHLLNCRLVVNFDGLSFVGSLGVTEFVETIKQLVVLNRQGVKFGSMANEFRRMLESEVEGMLPVYETAQMALLAFQGVSISPLSRLSVVEPADSLSVNEFTSGS